MRRLRLSAWSRWDIRVPRALPIRPHRMDTWGGQGRGQHRGDSESRWHLVVSLRPLGLTGYICSLHAWELGPSFLEFGWPLRARAGASMVPCGGSWSLRAHCNFLVCWLPGNWGRDSSICRRGRSVCRGKRWPGPQEKAQETLSQSSEAAFPTCLPHPPTPGSELKAFRSMWAPLGTSGPGYLPSVLVCPQSLFVPSLHPGTAFPPPHGPLQTQGTKPPGWGGPSPTL